MSSEKISIKDLKAKADIVSVIGGILPGGLEKKGSEYKGMCPWHEDSKPSLNVNPSKNVWMCPACGGDKKGDVFDFLKCLGKTLPEAMQIVADDINVNIDMPEKKILAKSAKKKKEEWKHVRPVVDAIDFTHYKNGQPDAIYEYRDEKGLIGYVCRFNLADGTKETLPFCYTQSPDGTMYRWSYQGFNHRPLYNAHLIMASPHLPVIMVEGEKVAKWMQERSGGKFIAATWVGGSNQVEKTSFELLDGKRVLSCRDNDAPGLKCMTYIHDKCKAEFKKWGEIPEGAPKAWDMADSGYTPQQVQDFVRRSLREPIKKKHDQDEEYFTYLGFEKNETSIIFIFYCKQSKTIFRFTAASMSKPNLMCMAPLYWWEQQFGSFKNTEAATNMLIGTSYKVGIYSPKNVRGRGAWYDDGRVVIHAGDKLIVDGKSCELGDLDTQYIYEIGESFNFNTENPLSAKAAHRILEVTKLLNWERKVNAHLLAGWCVIAPICGALKWRPHIWLTGPAGSGKSWVFTFLLRKLLGDTVLDVQGATTEAGIRQSLGFDAMPVAFDEIDGNDARSQARIQENLELARSASADDTGKIVKGSASHNAKSFHIRSCFAFSSISVGIDKGSDRRRITTLSLIASKTAEPDPEKQKANWEHLQRVHQEVVTDDFVSGLHARTIKLLPVILENSKIFNSALVSELGVQAMADQLGPMLAGAYSLSSDKLIGFEDAVAFVRSQDWEEETEGEKVKDEIELFHFLMQWMLKVDGWGERNVAELISFAAMLVPASSLGDEQNISSSLAMARLKRSGIRVEGNRILISTASSEVKKRLDNTRWSKNYGSVLKRLDDAKPDNQRFTGASERCVSLPIAMIK